MTSLRNELGEWKILRGGKYSDDLAGEQYSVGGERYFAGMLIIICWGYLCCIGSVDGLRWGKKTLSRTLFPWLLSKDNPVISC